MGSIVCATRGGAGSRAVQEHAVRHARERGQNLIFLYVVDTSGLSEADETLREAVEIELDWLGRTLLRIAQIRAENEGTASTVVIRQGRVVAEICSFISEQAAELLLLGAPRGTTASIIGDDPLEILAERICQQTGVPVEVVRPDSGGSSGPTTIYCAEPPAADDQPTP